MITKRKIWIGSSIIIAIMSLLFIQSCKKNTTASPFKIPSITTESVTSTETSAMVEANITSNGGITVTKSGVCWSSNDNPTIDDNITTDGILDIGQFSSEINTLTSNTKYYVRAYATNIEGTGYGNTISFTTKGKAQLTTADITELTAASAVSGGNITNDGGSEITARGVCWNTSIDPTISNNKTSDSVGSGIFSSKIINLTENVLYYARAYATNSSGTSYGNTISFTTTSATKPIITTAAISGITKTSAISGGAISSDGGAAITSRGVCWSTSSNPTIANNKTNDGTGTATFTSNITALNPNTLYYVRAYATNKAGISYGNEILFSTLIPTMPTLSSTSVISNITQTTATSGGTISDDGGSAITMRGVCWSTSTNPTISNSKTTDGTGIGSFTSNLTGLTAGVTYYVRAYAMNLYGTAYGNAVQFSTIDFPSLTSVAANSITTNSAGCGGNVTSDGGSAITDRGVCWSTSSNPTILNYTTNDGNGTGSFTSYLTGLTSGTIYYARAYATNSAGTAYGNQITFTTNVKIGDAFQGGKVFYILQASDAGYDANVQHGLICALADQTTTTGIRWNNGTNVTTNATATAIGSGSANTTAIIGFQGTGNTHAAGLTRGNNGGGYTDWFLPSLNELNQLYINRLAAITSYYTSPYWTSTEVSSTNARSIDFSNGSTVTAGLTKTSLYRVRAIRKF